MIYIQYFIEINELISHEYATHNYNIECNKYLNRKFELQFYGK